MRYQKFVQFCLEHAYFGNEQVEVFSIHPTEACALELKKYRLIFRATFNGCFVAAPVNEEDVQALVYKVPSNLELSFVVRSLDTRLWNYSDFPVELAPNSLYYFNIKSAKAPGLKKNNWLIARQKIFTIALPSDVESASVSVYAWGQPKPLETQQIKEGTTQVTFDMQAYQDGAYKIKVGSQLLEQAYLSNSLAHEKPFAVINWTLNNRKKTKALTAEFKFSDYLMTIPNRATLWRYFVNEKYNQVPDDALLEVVCSKPGYDFRKQRNAKENKTHTFVSKKTIPLLQTGTKGIELQLKDNEQQEKVLIDNLPNPGKDMVVIDNNRVYSDKYIYI